MFHGKYHAFSKSYKNEQANHNIILRISGFTESHVYQFEHRTTECYCWILFQLGFRGKISTH